MARYANLTCPIRFVVWNGHEYSISTSTTSDEAQWIVTIGDEIPNGNIQLVKSRDYDRMWKIIFPDGKTFARFTVPPDYEEYSAKGLDLSQRNMGWIEVRFNHVRVKY